MGRNLAGPPQACLKQSSVNATFYSKMGTAPSTFENPVDQSTPIIVFNQQFALPYQITLKTSERRSFWSDNFKILNVADDSDWFSIEHQKVSWFLPRQRILCDNQGNLVANFRHVISFFRTKYIIFNGQRDICTLVCRNSFSNKIKFRANLVNQATGENLEVNLKSDRKLRNFNIHLVDSVRGGQLIATANRPKKSWRTRDIYSVQIASGVDVAFIVFLILAVDEILQERRRPKSNGSGASCQAY